ncbi:hypothetical protein GCM10022384_03910 [Streptomyces marokkonensis]|uniref:Uncharacterized protein n=1 Tax=Streptomyces marokkonensis TaxID=324855 RepID=A0ABP7NT59_9ACTN
MVLSGPHLADTDTGTNDAARLLVTRRTGEKAPELTYDTQTRPRHSSSVVIASAVPGRPSAWR